MKDTIVPYNYNITIDERREANKHKSFVILFTGLSGSGKSTIANLVEQKLFDLNIKTYTLDGDVVRKGLSGDLGFTNEDRNENIRRAAEVSKLFVDAGLVVITSFIMPFKVGRERLRSLIGKDNLVEIFVNTSLEECERRDVKGLYKKARAGEIKNMTGITSEYEAPEHPDLEIKTENESAVESAERVINYITPLLKL